MPWGNELDERRSAPLRIKLRHRHNLLTQCSITKGCRLVRVLVWVFSFISILQFGIQVPTYAQSASAADERFSDEATEAFLRRMGFEDYSKIIANNLANQVTAGLPDAPREVLEDNQKRYEVVNAARRVALRLAKILRSDTISAERKVERDAQLCELVARAIGLQPTNGDVEFPPYIDNIEDEDKRTEARMNYVGRIVTKEILLQSKATTSNFIKVLYGEEKARDFLNGLYEGGDFSEADKEFGKELLELEADIQHLITFMWLDSTLGQTRYVGRAMALVMARYAILKEDKKLMKTLEDAVALHGHDLDNFITNKAKMKDVNYNEVTIELKNGDRIFERTREKEAAQITAAAIPHYTRWFFAYRHGLIGPLRAMAYPIGEDIAPKYLTTFQSIRLWAATRRTTTRGVSHIGAAWVPEDVETGLKTAWALDNYPGGIRLGGIMDAFSQPGVFMSFAMARDDAYKLWDLAHAQIEKRKEIDPDGYVEALWESDLKTLDSKGRIKSGKKAKWPTLISREEFVRLHSIPRERAEEWYAEIMKRAMDHIRITFMTEMGVNFAYGFGDKPFETYCSLTYLLSVMQTAGFDIQKRPDQFRPSVWLLAQFSHTALGKKIGALKAFRDLDTDQRIVSPSGLAASPTIGIYEYVRFPKMDQFEQARSLSRSVVLPLSDALAKNWVESSRILRARVGELGGEQEVRVGQDEEELFETTIRQMAGNSEKRLKSDRAGVASGGRGPRSFLDRCVDQIASLPDHLRGRPNDKRKTKAN